MADGLEVSFSTSSSTDAMKQVVAAALLPVDPDAAHAVEVEKNWRQNYYKHMVAVHKASCATARRAELVASAGLAAVRTTFKIGSETLGKVECQSSQHRADVQNKFVTVMYAGSGASQEYACPVDGKKVPMAELRDVVGKWAAEGFCEPNVVDAINRLHSNPEWLSRTNLQEKFTFAILGALSQMGPVRTLLSLGATVLAIDLPGRESAWSEMIRFARASPGKLVLPILATPALDIHTGGKGCARMPETKVACFVGCNLLSHCCEIAQWISSTADDKTQLVLGHFLYADGALFSRLAVAADVVTSAVCAQRPDVALLSLCSPTEVYSVPPDAQTAAHARYAKVTLHMPWERAVSILSGGRYLERNHADRVGLHLVQDSQVWSQGPNYAFAKVLQRWRNLVARSGGHTVSANVAPASLTLSVMHNPLIRAGMLGCQHFGIRPFEPSTSNALMTALALHDLQFANSAAAPGTVLEHPFYIFHENAVHGGTWRCGFVTNSYTEVSAVLYGLGVAVPYVGGAAATTAALVFRSRL